MFELGPQGDDSIVIKGGFDASLGTAPVDHDLASVCVQGEAGPAQGWGWGWTWARLGGPGRRGAASGGQAPAPGLPAWPGAAGGRAGQRGGTAARARHMARGLIARLPARVAPPPAQAIVGGTGRYTGATGHVLIEGTDPADLASILTMWVPRLKPFA